MLSSHSTTRRQRESKKLRVRWGRICALIGLIIILLSVVVFKVRRELSVREDQVVAYQIVQENGSLSVKGRTAAGRIAHVL